MQLRSTFVKKIKTSCTMTCRLYRKIGIWVFGMRGDTPLRHRNCNFSVFGRSSRTGHCLSVCSEGWPSIWCSITSHCSARSRCWQRGLRNMSCRWWCSSSCSLPSARWIPAKWWTPKVIYGFRGSCHFGLLVSMYHNIIGLSVCFNQEFHKLRVSEVHRSCIVAV